MRRRESNGAYETAVRTMLYELDTEQRSLEASFTMRVRRDEESITKKLKHTEAKKAKVKKGTATS
jgi:hypothetical protein